MTRKTPTIGDLRKVVPLLEKLSLLRANEKTANRFEDTVALAQLMHEVDVSDVEPMYTLHENRSLRLRDDVVEPTDKKNVLEPSSQVIEDYFVAPPGNVSIEDSKSSNDLKKQLP